MLRSLVSGKLIFFCLQNVELSTVTKSRALAACWQLRKHELAEHLLSLENHFNIPEVLKALKILGKLDLILRGHGESNGANHHSPIADGPRRLRALEKKSARLEKQGTAKPKTIGLVRAKINDLKKDVPNVGSLIFLRPSFVSRLTSLLNTDTQVSSVTGALAKRVKKWVLSISKENLEFYALQLPREPWYTSLLSRDLDSLEAHVLLIRQELADMIHLKATDFQLPWFLAYVFGQPAPEESLVIQAQKLTQENAEDLVKQFKFPYSFLRKNLPDMPAKIKAQVAAYEVGHLVAKTAFLFLIFIYSSLPPETGHAHLVLRRAQLA